ncbi:hypothetical protein NL676_021532 [Syzygium grande]|nr:hypothetical protein NL676_021532 [Syzygium grande]
MSWSKDNTKQQGITVEADYRRMLTSRGGGAGTRHDQEELAPQTLSISLDRMSNATGMKDGFTSTPGEAKLLILSLPQVPATAIQRLLLASTSPLPFRWSHRIGHTQFQY